MENVDSWIFLCPSGRDPLQDGVLTADSGKVGVGHERSSFK